MKNFFLTLLLFASTAACACTRPEFATEGVRRVAETSLRVEVRCGDEVVGYGSAVAVGPREALTARHVAVHPDCTGETKLSTIDYRGRVEPVTVGKAGATVDAATLVLVRGHEFAHFALIDTDPVSVGERLYIFAGVTADLETPGLNFTLKEAIADTYVKLDGTPYLVASVHLVQGNSGGGVFDADGCLVGIVNKGAWFPDAENRVLAAPAPQLAAFLR